MKQFGFTADTPEEVFDKVSNYTTLDNLLNSKLIVRDYTANINKILFVFHVIDERVSLPINNYVKYRRKNKVLEIGIALNYTEFLNIDNQTVKQLLAETYLIGIDLYTKRKDFDNKRFYKDVEKLFIENGLLPQAVVA